MRRLFEHCSATCIHLKGFDTQRSIAYRIPWSTIGTGIAYMFHGCRSLRFLILDSQEFTFKLEHKDSYYTYTEDIFADLPAECRVLVPKALIPTYRAAPIWKEHADRIEAMEDYEFTGSSGIDVMSEGDLIASSGRLQAYDFSGEGSLKTVDDAPVCDMVFQRSARLCRSLSGSDSLTLSAVGDRFTWAVDDDDKSKGAWLDVGYGDSGDIIAVVPLATDLLIFKNNGMIYQLVGDQAIDTWAVYRVATETDAVGHGCAVAVGNDAVFVSRQGMKTMHTTMDYGNIAQGDIGEKWNALVVKSLYEPEMFHLRRRKLLLIRPTAHKESLIAYNYAVGAATTLSFSVPVTAIVERPDGLLVLSNREAYRMEETNLTDNGAPIDYRLRVRDIVSSDEIIVRGVDSSMAAEQAGEALVEVDAMRLSMPVNARRKVRTNHTSARIVTTVSSQTPFQIKHLALEVADL